MASQPQLAEEVMPCLSTQAQAVVNSYLSAPLKQVIDSTDNSCLPEILVSPPWRSKKKMTAPRLDLASLELTPQVYWQLGERETCRHRVCPLFQHGIFYGTHGTKKWSSCTTGTGFWG